MGLTIMPRELACREQKKALLERLVTPFLWGGSLLKLIST